MAVTRRKRLYPHGDPSSSGSAAEVAAATSPPALPVPRAGDLIFGLAALVFFVAGFLLSREWPSRAALFPTIVTLLGIGLSGLKVITVTRLLIRHRRDGANGNLPGIDDPPAQAEGSDVEIVVADDEQLADAGAEYVFASAGSRAWAAALAWIGGFFVAFFVLGAFLTVPLFALFYLRYAGRTSWWAAALYAVVTGVIIYTVFREVVFIPLPESVFPFLDI